MNVDGVCIPRFKDGTFVWVPAPAVARIVIEHLRQAIQKRTQLAHVWIVPILLWREWRRHIYKSVGLIIEIPAGCGDKCPREMHKKLIIVIYFHYLNRCPWDLLVGMGRYLWSVFGADYLLGGCVLSQNYKQTWGVGTFPFGQLRKLLSHGSNPTLPSQ